MNFLVQVLLKSFSFIYDCLFPKNCLGCGQENAHLCSKCLESLTLAKGNSCFICGRRSPQGYACEACRKKTRSKLSGLLVSSDWENPLLKQLIYAYKYRFISELADPLSAITAEYLKLNFLDDRNSQEIVLVAVPLHPKRFAWRGFNQAELLAKKISHKLNLPLAEKILIRHRYTSPQAEIKNQAERETNINNAFSLEKNIGKNKEALKDKIVILVDDVATTGATLQACAKELRPLSPKEIWGLVIARG